MWHCVKVVIAYSTDKTFRLEERNITELSDCHYTRHLPVSLYLRALSTVKLFNCGLHLDIKYINI